MTSLSVPALRCGGPRFLPHSTLLRAGPLTLLLEEGELRRIRMGNTEVIRRIYTSLRGPNWAPVPVVLSEQKVEAEADAFRLTYTLTHQHAEFDFTWKVTVTGTSEGTLVFQAQGKAASAFSTNRASLCVLHPLKECVGRGVRFTTQTGEEQIGQFPEWIDPKSPFSGFESFAHEIEPGLWAELKYTGETFEMEDQRNWSDGSFKTYSPPQNRPKPVRIEPGWETNQSVTLFLHRTSISESVSEEKHVNVPRPLPSWGFGTSTHGLPFSAQDIARLKILAPAHLRANYRLEYPSYLEELIRTVAESRALGVPLEIALFLPNLELSSLLAEFLQAWQKAQGDVIRWILFFENQTGMPLETLENVRKSLKSLAPKASFAVGSREDFVLLNRNRPENSDQLEFTYGLTPQVHLYDNRTMVEALEGQAWTLRTFNALWSKAKVVLSPITLKRPPLTVAIRNASKSIQLDQWQSQIDPRQASLFGAGWTLASLKAIALNAPSRGLSATYFEATGLLGLMCGENSPSEFLTIPGSDLKFEPGWVFPLYHVFADFAEFRGGQVLDLELQFPQRFSGLILSRGNRRTVLVANLEETSGPIRLESIGPIKGLRRLNEKNAMQAMASPEAYRDLAFESVDSKDDFFELLLLPFELIRLELGN